MTSHLIPANAPDDPERASRTGRPSSSTRPDPVANRQRDTMLIRAAQARGRVPTAPAQPADATEAPGSDPGVLRSPLAGLVVAIPVSPGEWVEAGEVVCVVESMKCEHRLLAPTAGYVQPSVALGETLDAQAPVATLVPVDPTKAKPRPMEPWAVIDELIGRGEWAHAELASGAFVEHDLVVDLPLGREVLAPVTRQRDHHESGVVVGVVSHVLRGHPDGVRRVWIAGDPRRSLGALTEAECRRINAAIDLAEREDLVVEWIAVSAGARISWDSGTENMDWCAEVARRIIEFTDVGGVINIVVAGVNVGAQSYWNSLATMLPHTTGALVQIEGNAMVLTGPRALALSGGGHYRSDAELGGYDEVMGPNGEAHYRAANLEEAYGVLFDLLSLTSLRADQSAPRSVTEDTADRSICDDPVDIDGRRVRLGDVLERAVNPKRKAPFPIRSVLHSLADVDGECLERWEAMAGGAGVVSIDSRVGGYPLQLLGVEAMPREEVDENGQPCWRAGGTLYPGGSRKMARALVAASGSRPAVVLASLAGFDGSASSLAGRQLEYGAAIADAVTHFDGPVLVVALGRFHGGAYVVLSRRLNEQLTLIALPESFVSVIGGDAAAGVVLHKEVTAMAEDPDAPALDGIDDVDERHRAARAEVAARFDAVHSVQRAIEMGSVDAVVEPSELRSYVANWAHDAWQQVVQRQASADARA